MKKTHRRWSTPAFIVGASLIALTIAARRLGWGTGAGTEPTSPWLALLFLSGAALLLAVLVARLTALIRKR